MRKPISQPARRRAQRFGNGAKASASVMAVAALIGGWNWIAHLDSAKAGVAPGVEKNAAAPAGQVPEQFAQTRQTYLAPLTIPTVPPLPVRGSGQLGMPATDSNVLIGLPDLPSLAPLPTLAPLPSMPSLPPAPPANAGGGSTNSGGS